MATFNTVDGTVCNAKQYNQSQELGESNYTGPSISCLTHGESIGLALTAEASLISSISIIGMLVLISGPATIYMFSLFMFDFLQSIGGILNIRWAHKGIVTTGSFCTAQGVIEQIGDLGVALTTLFLAVQTFVTVVWQVGLNSRRVALGLVCLICVFVTLWVTLGATIHKHYEVPTPYWCWISPHFSKERVAGEYLWMWIALFASAILYIPLYFWAEGFWSLDEKYRFQWRNADQRVEYAQRRMALGMLLYPLGYSLVVLPLSIARWLQFDHHRVSSAATIFTVSLFYLSGAINVFLFLTIRPELLFPRPRPLDEPEMQVTFRDTSLAIFSETVNYRHISEPTSALLGDGCPEEGAARIWEDGV